MNTNVATQQSPGPAERDERAEPAALLAAASITPGNPWIEKNAGHLENLAGPCWSAPVRNGCAILASRSMAESA